MPQTFLTAEWRSLAILTFPVDPMVLTPLVPRGTELDTVDGRAFISLVGFRFLDTRVLGFRVPFHEHFDEVNLRFYVRRDVAGDLRRGVTFIREFVPRRLIAFVARIAYNEPYATCAMRSEVPINADARPCGIRYAWKDSGRWYHIGLTATKAMILPREYHGVRFVTERHWGYTRQRDGSTLEYRVDHPPWRVWEGEQPEVGGEMEALYGPPIGHILQAAPASAVFAEGSKVTVYRPTPVAAADRAITTSAA